MAEVEKWKMDLTDSEKQFTADNADCSAVLETLQHLLRQLNDDKNFIKYEEMLEFFKTAWKPVAAKILCSFDEQQFYSEFMGRRNFGTACWAYTLQLDQESKAKSSKNDPKKDKLCYELKNWLGSALKVFSDLGAAICVQLCDAGAPSFLIGELNKINKTIGAKKQFNLYKMSVTLVSTPVRLLLNCAKCGSSQAQLRAAEPVSALIPVLKTTDAALYTATIMTLVFATTVESIEFESNFIESTVLRLQTSIQNPEERKEFHILELCQTLHVLAQSELYREQLLAFGLVAALLPLLSLSHPSAFTAEASKILGTLAGASEDIRSLIAGTDALSLLNGLLQSGNDDVKDAAQSAIKIIGPVTEVVEEELEEDNVQDDPELQRILAALCGDGSDTDSDSETESNSNAPQLAGGTSAEKDMGGTAAVEKPTGESFTVPAATEPPSDPQVVQEVSSSTPVGEEVAVDTSAQTDPCSTASVFVDESEPKTNEQASSCGSQPFEKSPPRQEPPISNPGEDFTSRTLPAEEASLDKSTAEKELENTATRATADTTAQRTAEDYVLPPKDTPGVESASPSIEDSSVEPSTQTAEHEVVGDKQDKRPQDWSMVEIPRCAHCSPEHTIQGCRLLPCLHTLCEVKLQELYDRGGPFQCIECDTRFTIPSEGISGLPSRTMFYELALAQDFLTGKPVHCGVCVRRRAIVEKEQAASSEPPAALMEPGPAEAWCFQCADPLCSACAAYHLLPVALQQHVIISLSEVGSIAACGGLGFGCPKHSEEQLTKLCRTCDNGLCELCMPEHESHDLQVAQHQHQIAHEQLSPQINRLEQCLESCANHLRQLEEHRASVCGQMHEVSVSSAQQAEASAAALDQQIAALQAEKDGLLQRHEKFLLYMERVQEDFRKKCRLQEESMRKKQGFAAHVLQCARIAQKHGTQIDVFAVDKQLASQIHLCSFTKGLPTALPVPRVLPGALVSEK